MKSKHCHELISLPKQYFDDNKSDATDDFSLTVIILRKKTLWTSHSTSLQKKKLLNPVFSREALRGFLLCWLLPLLFVLMFRFTGCYPFHAFDIIHQVYLYKYWPMLYFQANSLQSDLGYFHLTFLTFHCFAWSCCWYYGHVVFLLAPYVLRIWESVFHLLLIAAVILLLMLLRFLRCFSCNASAMDLKEVFSTLGIFYLTLLSDEWLNLHLSTLP